MDDENTLFTHPPDPQNDFRAYNAVEFPVPVQNKVNKLPQYIATISATFSALAAGVVLGWTSPITHYIEDGKYHNITVNDYEMGWIGSLTTIGALITCIPTGYICDMIGRKTTLLLLFAPFSLGWSLLVWANNIGMMYAGRFILGIAAGACCIAAPMYTSEIAHKSIRGSLGSYFQLMVTIGILYSYVLGAFLSVSSYTVLCGLTPFIFIFTFVFQPETPLYYIKKQKFEKAKMSLLRLRGISYDIFEELIEIETSTKNSQQNIGILNSLRKKSNQKGLMIGLSLMVFQQLSGINAVIFYTGEIFDHANITINSQYATIIVGVCQVVVTFISSLIVDRLGRRKLLLISSFFMSVAMILMGIFFALKDHNVVSKEVVKSLNFIPILSLVLYIVVFSLGLGPIPWLIMGEIFSPEIKSMATSVSGSVNWFLAFLITKLYLQVDKKVGDDFTFFFFAIVLMIAVLFIYYFVPETKGKTITEIQAEFES